MIEIISFAHSIKLLLSAEIEVYSEKWIKVALWQWANALNMLMGKFYSKLHWWNPADWNGSVSGPETWFWPDMLKRFSQQDFSQKILFHPNTDCFMEAAPSLTTLEVIVSHEVLNIWDYTFLRNIDFWTRKNRSMHF